MSDDFRDNITGRFLPGNPGSPGRLPRIREQSYIDELKAKCPPERLADELMAALEMAKKQNSPRAVATIAELILSYTVGRPKQSVSIGAPDNTALLMEILADRTPLLPPRQGVIEGGPPLLEDAS